MNIQKEYLAEVGLRKKVEADLDRLIHRIQEMEEDNNKQETWRAVEEKKYTSWEEEKRAMMDMIKKQQVMIDKFIEKVDQWDEKEISGDDMGEKNDSDKDNIQDPLIEDNYTEPVDYNASQDSVESLGSKLGISDKEKKEKDKEGPTRRSDRNLDKKDSKIEDLAKERAADKDNYEK
ncbi:uncharacterized protein [Triticum aestivum]|uniref:uncharacterized protein n=1 Tax=Triticum aestivum TaxID=4565 RepID=UPI001D026FD6|nr:uncharacterized protein LOC123100558 [Triticum aestivum]